MVVTFASFQQDGRFDSRKQWLSKYVTWTKGLFARIPP